MCSICLAEYVQYIYLAAYVQYMSGSAVYVWQSMCSICLVAYVCLAAYVQCMSGSICAVFSTDPKRANQMQAMCDLNFLNRRHT